MPYNGQRTVKMVFTTYKPKNNNLEQDDVMPMEMSHNEGIIGLGNVSTSFIISLIQNID